MTSLQRNGRAVASYEEAAHWLAALDVDAAARRWVKPALYAWCVEGQRPLAALLSASVTEVAEVCGLDEAQARTFLGLEARLEAARAALRPLAEWGVEVVTRADVAYPEELTARLPEERLPYCWLYKGDLGILTEPGVAMIGAGQPDARAEATVRTLASGLVEQERHLVGGYERGVDRLALDAAAQAGGKVTLVAPLGLAHCRALLEGDAPAFGQGRRLVLSPFAPEAPLAEAQARARRTLVAALCDVLCLVAPDEGPDGWPFIAELMRQGLRASAWRGSEAEGTRRWLALGARPFDGRANELAQAEADAPTSALPAAASEPLGGAVMEETAPIAFADADEAISVLGRSGRVPAKLARRLRESPAWTQLDPPTPARDPRAAGSDREEQR